MCFFDQYRFSCGDWKWGNFRNHCNREWRTGETCGMKLVMQTIPIAEKCKLCEKIDTKQRRRATEIERIHRWKKEGAKFAASIDRSTDVIKALEKEINDLGYERQHQLVVGGGGLMGAYPAAIPVHTPAVASWPSRIQADQLARKDDWEYSARAHPSKVDVAQRDLPLQASPARQLHALETGFGTHAHPDHLDNKSEPRNYHQQDELDEVLPRSWRATHPDMTANRLRKANVKMDEANDLIYERYKKSQTLPDAPWLSNSKGLDRNSVKSQSSAPSFFTAPSMTESLPITTQKSHVGQSDVSALTELNVLRDRPYSPIAKAICDLPDDSDVSQHEIPFSDDASAHLVAGDGISTPELPLRVAQDDARDYSKRVEIRWQCQCGLTFQEAVTEYKPSAATRLAPFENGSRDIDIESQVVSTGSSSEEATLSVSSSAMSEGCRTRSSPTSEGKLQLVKLHPQDDDDDDAMRKRVLLCTRGRGSQEVKAACVTKSQTDRCMFNALHDSLYSAKRKLIYWATLRRLTGIDFVEFHIYWRNNVTVLPEGIGKLPPPETSDYLCSRVTSPPVLLTALHHFIEHPSHAPAGTNYLERMPKKLGKLPEIGKDGLPVVGYGLQIEESICWTKALIMEGCISIVALVFATVWCAARGGDVQDGFTVAGVVLAYGTLILASLQGIAQQRALVDRFR